MIRDKDRSPTAIGSRISARRRRLNDPVYDPFWQQARELDIPVAEHRGWLGYWLDRMDGHVEKMRTYAPWLKKPPREYFLEQCYLTMDPDESTLKAMVDLGVERNVLWGSDYPHFDCTYPGVLKEVRAAIEMLPEHARQSILTDNAIRFYNL